MITEQQHRALLRPFPETEIEWRLARASKNSSGTINGFCLAYIQARAVMERLDLVFGPGGWSDSLIPISMGNVAGFVCRLEAGGVIREDVADLTDIEALKGGASGALKRVAVKFGIGRYLYDLHDGQIEASSNGRFNAKLKESNEWFRWSPPKLPDWAVPDALDVKIGDEFVEVPLEFVALARRMDSAKAEEQYLKALSMAPVPVKAASPFNKRWTPSERQEALIMLKAQIDLYNANNPEPTP
jgi:hypothetical protein